MDVYFGTYKLAGVAPVYRLTSQWYYLLFFILVIFRKKTSKIRIVISPNQILGENGYFSNNTLFFLGKNERNLRKKLIEPIISIIAERNYFLLENYTNTLFIEVKPTNLKFIKIKVKNFDTYDRVFLKVRSVNRKNFNIVSDFISENSGVILVDKYVPSINIVSKVSTVFTDDSLALNIYYLLSLDVYFIKGENKLIKTPEKVVSLFEDKVVSYERYLINNLLYTFLLTVPDQLIENNINHQRLLSSIQPINNTSGVTQTLLGLVDVISEPTKAKEEKFINSYRAGLENNCLINQLYVISELLIVNCKLDLLNRLISITVKLYIKKFLGDEGERHKFYDFFYAVKVLSPKLSGRIVDYNFFYEGKYNKSIGELNLSVKELALLITIFIDNRNENLIELAFDSVSLPSESDLLLLRQLLSKDFIKLGALFERYHQYWRAYLSKYAHFYDEELIDSLYIDPYVKASVVVDDDPRMKKLNMKIKKLKILNLNKNEVMHGQGFSEYQKFVLLLQKGSFNEATLVNNIRGKKTFPLYLTFKSRAEVVRHISTSNKILISTENDSPKQDTVIIDISLGCMNSKTQFFALFPWINRNNLQFTSLLNGFSIKTTRGDPKLEKINTEFNINWLLQTFEYIDMLKVDLPNKEVSYEGVNYYHGFYEAAACTGRTYDVDYTLDINNIQGMARVHRASILIEYLEKAYIYAEHYKKRLIFVAGNSHLAPYSCIRDYILSKKSEYFNFVTIGASYENYYSNFSTNYSKCFGIVNQSFNPTIRAAFLPEKNKFENWLALNPENKEISDKVQSLIKMNRNFSENSTCKKLLKRIQVEKKCGKKIICCFGKIVFDSAVFYDGGPAHSGFKDWLNHTIEIAAQSPEILILIKPHPHELKVEIAMKIGQYLRDIIPAQLPENVIFLDHDSFNTHEIARIVDLAVLWNGTSSMELTSLGVPVMMCGHFGVFDYHLDLIYPNDRQDYKAKLLDIEEVVINEQLKYRAMAYVSYMGHHETSIPNEYARRQLLNDPVGIPIWREEKLHNLINVDDSHMEYALNKIVYKDS